MCPRSLSTHRSSLSTFFSRLITRYPFSQTIRRMHHLLQQQLRNIGFNDEALPPPTAEQWQQLLDQINHAYHTADEAQALWRTAYESQRDEMEGTFENLRRSSADIITSERDKLQAIIHALGEGLCALNQNGIMLFLNAQGENLLGWPEEELRGQLILDWIMPSADDETTTERLFDLIRDGETYRQENSAFIQQDGRHLPVSYTLAPLFRDEQFSGAVLVFRDITAVKQAAEERERQLRETLLLNRVIAATTSSLDLTTVLQTICAELAHFLKLPQAAFALLNRDKDELTIVAEYFEEGRIPALGTVIPIANNPATQEVMKTKKSLVISDAQSDPRQSVLHDVARRRGTRSMLIVPMLVGEEILGTLGLNATVSRHFTKWEIELVQNVALATSQAVENAELYTAVQQELAERRRTEEELAQARDKALEASRLKTQLIAKVSHELRTPLTSIIGFAEMIQLGLYGRVVPDQVDALEKIMRSTDDLVILVNDLLDLSQLEAGTLRLNRLPFKPSELLERMERNMRLIAEKKGLTLDVRLDPSLPEQLLGDADRLHQVVMNLVGNALKFTSLGFVRISIGRLLPDHWQIVVTDTGPGIPPELHSAIFDEFRQGSNPTALVGTIKGVGLGLSIVKQITTAMGGTIKLESAVGEGSTFVVILPLVTAVHNL